MSNKPLKKAPIISADLRARLMQLFGPQNYAWHAIGAKLLEQPLLLTLTPIDLATILRSNRVVVEQALLTFGEVYPYHSPGQLQQLSTVVQYMLDTNATETLNVVVARFGITAHLAGVARSIAELDNKNIRGRRGRRATPNKTVDKRAEVVIKLKDESGLTYAQIADVFGLTRQRIEQIYSRGTILNKPVGYSVVVPMGFTRTLTIAARTANEAKLLALPKLAAGEGDDTSAVVTGSMAVYPNTPPAVGRKSKRKKKGL